MQARPQSRSWSTTWTPIDRTGTKPTSTAPGTRPDSRHLPGTTTDAERRAWTTAKPYPPREGPSSSWDPSSRSASGSVSCSVRTWGTRCASRSAFRRSNASRRRCCSAWSRSANAAARSPDRSRPDIATRERSAAHSAARRSRIKHTSARSSARARSGPRCFSDTRATPCAARLR